MKLSLKLTLTYCWLDPEKQTSVICTKSKIFSCIWKWLEQNVKTSSHCGLVTHGVMWFSQNCNPGNGLLTVGTKPLLVPVGMLLKRSSGIHRHESCFVGSTGAIGHPDVFENYTLKIATESHRDWWSNTHLANDNVNMVFLSGALLLVNMI